METVPAGASPDELLDLGERFEREDRTDAVATVLTALDAAVPDPRRLDPQRTGRRATLLGDHLAERDPDAAVAAWQHAVERFVSAGDEGSASAVRGRIGVALCVKGGFDQGRPLVTADVTHQETHGGARRRAEAWARMAQVHVLAGDPQAADQAQDRADRAAAGTGDGRLVAAYALRRARNRERLGRTEEARAAADQALAFYREHGPAESRAMAAILAAGLSDEAEAAVTYFTEALDAGVPELAPTARIGRARARMRLGRASDAVPDLVEAVALSAGPDQVEAAAVARQDLAHAYRLTGRYVSAAKAAEEALAGFTALGLDGPADDTRLLLAALFRELDNLPGALWLYQDVLVRLIGNPAGLGQVGELAGQVLYDLGRDSEAADMFRSAAANLRDAGDPVGEMRLWRRTLNALHYADRVEDAEEVIRLAARRYAELATEPPIVWSRAMFAYETGRFLMARGRAAEAVHHLAGSADRLRAVGAERDAELVAGMDAEARLRSGDPAGAETVLRPLLAAMAPDAPTRAVAVTVLAQALDALDRPAEAVRLRESAGLNAR